MGINRAKAAHITTVAVACTVALAMAGPAAAYVLYTDTCGIGHWASNTSTYRTSTTDFPSAGAPHAAIESAAAMWNAGSGQDIRGADLTVVHGSHTTITTHSGTDTFNSITDENLAAGVLGSTTINLNPTTCELYEQDIALDPNFWQVYPVINNAEESYSTVTLHEVGHAVGLNHEDDYPDTMNSINPGSAQIGGWDRAGEDAREGLRGVYGDNSTGVDLAVSSFRFSDHTSGGVHYAERSPVGSTCGDSQTDSQHALAGVTISRCFCIHDLGTTTQSGIVMKLYFSSDDDIIETTDTVAATWTSIRVAPNSPYCAERTFAVPALASGYYRIGVIIDPPNAISEYDESDNKASDRIDFFID